MAKDPARAAYLAKRYADRMAHCRGLLGNKCVRCGTSDDLEFDHVDPMTKLFAIADGYGRPMQILEAEVAKCQLLCRPHHVEKSYGNGDLPPRLTHGSNSMYTTGRCRCRPCKDAHAELMRKYRTNKRDP